MQALCGAIAQFSLSGAARWMSLRRVDISDADTLTVEPEGIAIHHTIYAAAYVAKSELS